MEINEDQFTDIRREYIVNNINSMSKSDQIKLLTMLLGEYITKKDLQQGGDGIRLVLDGKSADTINFMYNIIANNIQNNK